MIASNAPCESNIEIYRGDTWSLQFVAKRPDGSIVDLTGYSLRAQIRKKRNADEIVKSFSAVIDDAAAGLFSLTLQASVTAELDCGETRYAPASQYFWDVELTSPSGNRYTTHAGVAVVIPDTSRSL